VARQEPRNIKIRQGEAGGGAGRNFEAGQGGEEMTTAIAERRELHQAIDALPDEALSHLAPYIAFLRHEYDGEYELTGIAATRAAVAELRAGKGKRFHSMEDLMCDLNDENDA
jgi:hypothetical protein